MGNSESKSEERGAQEGDGEYDEEMAREGVVEVAFSVDGRSGRGLRFWISGPLPSSWKYCGINRRYRHPGRLYREEDGMTVR